jgi:hypothetical protein
MPASSDPVDPLTAQTGFTAAERKLRATLAAESRWAQPGSRETARVTARASMIARFEKQVDPDGVLPPAERAKLAESARRAHLLSMSLKSVRARRLRKEREKAKADKAAGAA